jgi:small subunit ribosomal protein S17
VIEEQEDKTTEEETPEAEAPVEETPAAEVEEAPAEEAPAEEAPAEEAPAEEAPAEEAPAEEAPAEEAPAEEAPAAEAPAPEPEAPAEPEEQLSPKERRKRTRGQAGEAKPPRSLEERLAERAAERERLAGHRRTRRQGERTERAKGAAERAGTPPPEREAGRKRIRQGIVVSDKADKTITVKIEIARPHRVYKKIVRTSATLHAHDERNEAHTGDTVRIVESRPLSRSKRWRLVEIMERAR